MDPIGAARLREAFFRVKEALGEEVSADPSGIPEGLSLLGPATAAAPRDGSLIFIQEMEAGTLERLAGLSGCVLIIPEGEEAGSAAERNLIVRARNPKYAYALLAGSLYPLSAWRGALIKEIGPSSYAAEDAVLEEGVIIEPFVTVGRGSRIGAGSVLMRGASIGPAVCLGRDCLIKENAVVGDLGFGFAFDPGRPPLRLPQLGGVRLGDRVEVGALSSVGAGTIEPTVIEEDVKISDHVHVAHNCRIGRASILTVGSSVSGSSRLGEGVWLAPGAVIRNKVRIGDGALIGLGAVVVGDVEAGETMAGLPARPFHPERG